MNTEKQRYQFGQKLKYHRRKNNLTLSRVCKVTKIPYSLLKKAEQGELSPAFHFGHLLKLSALYHISPYDFFAHKNM